MTERPKFDPSSPDPVLVRRIVLQRLRQEKQQWTLLADDNGKSFERYVEILAHYDSGGIFGSCVVDVLWALVTEGVIAPGRGNVTNDVYAMNFPKFHLTPYGQKVIETGEYVPHDPTGYMRLLEQQVRPIDGTVRSYMQESLQTFLRGNLMASSVMLGVAAERVLDMICDQLMLSLESARERKKLEQLMQQPSIRRRQEWVSTKLRDVSYMKPRPADYPEGTSIMIAGIYDLIRQQRNEFGHPQEQPPTPSREMAHNSLQLFPAFYKTAEMLRTFLSKTKM